MTLAKEHTRHGTIFMRNITTLDCGVFDLSDGIIGQSWIVDLEVSGELDKDGIVQDFSELKKQVRKSLKESVDHALLIPIKSEFVKFRTTSNGDECWMLTSVAGRGKKAVDWSYTCPKGAVYPIRSKSLDRETIALEINKTMGRRLPENITSYKISLREEDIDPTEAVFRYTHGITSHSGMCQRLFHGHRSCIEVHIGEVRRPDLEQYLVWEVLGKNIHIASESQVQTTGLEVGARSQSTEPVTIGYTSKSGLYEGILPANRVFVVPQETSIEIIAHTLAEVVRAKVGDTEDRIKVACYEGIEKGAVALS